MTAAVLEGLTVDQSLVDSYLDRVNRFVSNVERFEQQLKEMTANVVNRFTPEHKTEPVLQEPATAKSEPAVVTADDIDIDALLSGVDIGGMSL